MGLCGLCGTCAGLLLLLLFLVTAEEFCSHFIFVKTLVLAKILFEFLFGCKLFSSVVHVSTYQEVLSPSSSVADDV